MQIAQDTYKVSVEREFSVGMVLDFRTSDELPFGSYDNGLVEILEIGSYAEMGKAAESLYNFEITVDDEVVEDLRESVSFMLSEPWVYYKHIEQEFAEDGSAYPLAEHAVPLRWFALHTVSVNRIPAEALALTVK